MSSRAGAVFGLVVAGGVGVLVVGGVVVGVVVVATRRRYALDLVQRLRAEQARMAALIAREARAAGLSAALAGALIVNAYAESTLSERAAGDLDAGGIAHSYGLFQLSDRPGAMGAGMSVASRIDGATNVRRMLAALRGDEGHAVRAAADRGASVAELAALISRDLERPRDVAGEQIRRRTLAIRLFGAPATVRGSRIDYLSQ